MADLVLRYSEWLQHNRGRSGATAAKYEQALARLATYLAGRDLLAASAEDLNRFTGIYAHTELKLSPRARRPLVSAIKGFYGWAAGVRLLRANPAAELDYPRVGRTLPRAMSLHSAEQLLMQPDMGTFVGVRDAALLGVMLGCGPRVSGVCGLNQEDLLWSRHEGRERLVIRLREKGGKERLVPAPAETSMLLHAYLGHEELERIDRSLGDGQRVLFVSVANRRVPPHEYYGEQRRLAPRSVFDRLRRYGEMAGIPLEQLHPHAMRHLFGTEMSESDVNLLIHQDLMGHANADSTKIYSQLAMKKKIAAIDQASPMSKIRSPVSGLIEQLERAKGGAR